MSSAVAPPVRRGGVRIVLARGLLLVAVLITVMMAALAVGMRMNDAAIDQHRAVATATVLSVSPLATGIEFVDTQGLTIRPPAGVLYPGLLTVGQQFLVEYSTKDPTIVRVAGRTAAVGSIQIIIVLVLSWVLAGVGAWWLRRSAGRPLFPASRGAATAGAGYAASP